MNFKKLMLFFLCSTLATSSAITCCAEDTFCDPCMEKAYYKGAALLVNNQTPTAQATQKRTPASQMQQIKPNKLLSASDSALSVKPSYSTPKTSSNDWIINISSIGRVLQNFGKNTFQKAQDNPKTSIAFAALGAGGLLVTSLYYKNYNKHLRKTLNATILSDAQAVQDWNELDDYEASIINRLIDNLKISNLTPFTWLTRPENIATSKCKWIATHIGDFFLGKSYRLHLREQLKSTGGQKPKNDSELKKLKTIAKEICYQYTSSQ